MALFDALGELVGAAVLSAGPACDLIVPPEVAQQRAVLFAWLQARGESESLVSVVDTLAREIWVGVETRGLSQQALEQHMLAIAAILADHGPTRTHLTQVQERARAGANGQPASIEPLARRIAVDVFARARAAGSNTRW